jgi:hypothetical protein
MMADHYHMNLVYENSGPSLGMFQQLNFSEDGCRTARSGMFNSMIPATDSNQERLFEASIYGALRPDKDDRYTYFGSYRDFILARRVLPAISLTYGGTK